MVRDPGRGPGSGLRANLALRSRGPGHFGAGVLGSGSPRGGLEKKKKRWKLTFADLLNSSEPPRRQPTAGRLCAAAAALAAGPAALLAGPDVARCHYARSLRKKFQAEAGGSTAPLRTADIALPPPPLAAASAAASRQQRGKFAAAVHTMLLMLAAGAIAATAPTKGGNTACHAPSCITQEYGYDGLLRIPHRTGQARCHHGTNFSTERARFWGEWDYGLLHSYRADLLSFCESPQRSFIQCGRAARREATPGWSPQSFLSEAAGLQEYCEADGLWVEFPEYDQSAISSHKPFFGGLTPIWSQCLPNWNDQTTPKAPLVGYSWGARLAAGAALAGTATSKPTLQDLVASHSSFERDYWSACPLQGATDSSFTVRSRPTIIIDRLNYMSERCQNVWKYNKYRARTCVCILSVH